jgi:DeoR family glycerol-3-phosphate regulon repressor
MTVEALAEHFAVSAETIRRDLGQLAEHGTIQKVHGGAKRLRLHAEGSFQERMTENADAKRLIARKLHQLVEPGETVFMDTGSTTLFCAEVLAGIGRLTVITNSVRIAQTIINGAAGNVVYLLGGQFSGDNSQTVGPLAIEQIKGFQADHAILTIAAMDAEVGAMDANFDEACVAREMILRSRHLVVVANATKFNRRAAFRVCDLDEIDILVSDEPPGVELTAALREALVELR